MSTSEKLLLPYVLRHCAHVRRREAALGFGSLVPSYSAQAGVIASNHILFCCSI